MKQFWAILLSAVLLVSLIPCAGAEDSQDFTIDEQMVFSDMSRSYLQGYQPSTSYNRLNLVIPIRSEHAVGSINAELIPAQESIAPFKLQNMGVALQSGAVLRPAQRRLSLHRPRQRRRQQQPGAEHRL